MFVDNLKMVRIVDSNAFEPSWKFVQKEWNIEEKAVEAEVKVHVEGAMNI